MSKTAHIDSIDRHVAARLRGARNLAGVSQQAAAQALGVTFQQLQKYERGTNRISAGKLARLAQLYGEPLAWFFEGAPGLESLAPGRRGADALAVLARPAGVVLAQHFAQLNDSDAALVGDLARRLARDGLGKAAASPAPASLDEQLAGVAVMRGAMRHVGIG